ncbi:unnamed protein product [Adineta steineri]|uniref:Uncharacterized protein n=1 Tax=Adineta steineri TaxID=433720 RepID=A0A815UL41_9BILA|nr:unnamed protein product [Adineta steineri]
MAASRFIRFFSRRQAKKPTSILNDDINYHSNSKFLSNGKIHSTEKTQQIISIKNGLVCTIIFLDGEEVNFEVDVS